eukprot:TRINITY_DN5450_c0_g1_i1.p1 TRINITY_DN5450_c0_g1~~TRINITY_DN5450_c0_g1_i1.p1  ORF type:complete len:413 (-),score=46.29 TRINITY_DN5450_c0_g1_i1:187-1425(-)
MDAVSWIRSRSPLTTTSSTLVKGLRSVVELWDGTLLGIGSDFVRHVSISGQCWLQTFSSDIDSSIAIFEIAKGRMVLCGSVSVSIFDFDEGRRRWDYVKSLYLPSTNNVNSARFNVFLKLRKTNILVACSAVVGIELLSLDDERCFKTLLHENERSAAADLSQVQSSSRNMRCCCLCELEADELLVGSYEDASVKVWDLKSDSCVPIHVFDVGSSSDATWSQMVEVSDGGHSVLAVISDSDFFIVMWRVSRTEFSRASTLLGHVAPVISLARLQRDQHQQMLVSASNDKTIRLWNVSAGDGVGTCLRVFVSAGFVDSLIPLRNGTIASLLANGHVETWRVDYKLVDRCCEVLVRSTTSLKEIERVLPDELYAICLTFHKLRIRCREDRLPMEDFAKVGQTPSRFSHWHRYWR